jgi:glycosyltransferase involved in cell wall biosynthesis
VTSFCVFIPIKNGMPLIKGTVDSIVRQREYFDASLIIVVCDGGSTDGTLEYLSAMSETFNNLDIEFRLISREDTGMYDALANGMAKAGLKHDVYCYINAGDYFSPHAFFVVSGLISKDVPWLTGMSASYNRRGVLTSLFLPFWYPRRLIIEGFFGTRLPYIQQESTFWSRELQARIELDHLSKQKLAGDFYLWKTFAAYADLFIVHCWLGGFRTHDSQQSKIFKTDYEREFSKLAANKTFVSFLLFVYVWIVLKLPQGMRKRLSKKTLIC